MNQLAQPDWTNLVEWVDGSVEQNRFILLPKRVSSPTRIQAYLPNDTNNKKNSHQWKENKDLVVVGRYFEPQVTR